jgi:hypothetical protein
MSRYSETGSGCESEKIFLRNFCCVPKSTDCTNSFPANVFRDYLFFPGEISSYNNNRRLRELIIRLG